MSLVALVTARYSTQKLIEVTNPDLPGAVAINAPHLAAACDDAESDFLTYVGIAFDEANPSHIRPAVDRAYALLIDAMDPASAFAAALLDNSRHKLTDLRPLIGAGVRVSPATDIVTTPTTPDTSAGPVRPPFDPSRVPDWNPGAREGGPFFDNR